MNKPKFEQRKPKFEQKKPLENPLKKNTMIYSIPWFGQTKPEFGYIVYRAGYENRAKLWIDNAKKVRIENAKILDMKMPQKKFTSAKKIIL